ncbi:PPC domain-containing protein [Billgrantia sp. Q4P2]|uniref:PPC domain-containing protein n=1 Tax=Billgrantia sp. Q4P2 TaxID=3463857 RepID=UPI004056817A
MKRFVSSLSLMLLLSLTGCAGTWDPLDSATELVPGRAYEVMSAGHRYFTFTLDAPARVVLESHTFPGDTGLVEPAGQLLDANGRMVERDWVSGRNGNFRIERQLEPGTWYLRVTTPHASPSSFGTMERDYRYSVTLRVDRNR